MCPVGDRRVRHTNAVQLCARDSAELAGGELLGAIERKLRTDRKQVLRQVRDSVGYAKRSGRRVVLVNPDDLEKRQAMSRGEMA